MTNDRKLYSIFGKKGAMEEIKPVDELPIGSKIYSYGGGMSECIYCVASKRNEKGLQTIVLVSKFYFENPVAPISTIDKFIRPITQKYGIGKYYDDVDNYIYPSDEVEQFIKQADKIAEQLVQNTKLKDIADKMEREEIKAKFPHLKPIESGSGTYNEVKANIAAELKHNFPDTKFTLSKGNIDHIYVKWTDGASTIEVSLVLSKFNDHQFDHSGDFYDYTPSNFTRIFGGMKYITNQRTLSDNVKNLKNDLQELSKLDDRQVNDCFYRICRKTSIPKNATNLRIERTDVRCGTTEEFYSIAFDVPQSDNEQQIPQNLDIWIEVYSEKSIAVYGDTKPIKEQLSDLGGRFNFKLKGGAGWIFPKTKEEAVFQFIRQIQKQPDEQLPNTKHLQTPETIELNSKLEIVKIDCDYKFDACGVMTVVGVGFCFYIEGKGYLAFENEATPYTPIGGINSLEQILRTGGFATFEGMKFINPVNEIGVQRITCFNFPKPESSQ